MKTLATIVLATLTTIGAWAQPAQKGSDSGSGIEIRVVIDNVPNDEGKVLISLHKQDTFMRGEGIQTLESTIDDGRVEFTFEGVANGTYAIIALHDTNGNQQMDYAPNGMPKESWGMSGNAMVMGPPSFDLAKFEVSGKNLEFAIRF